MIGQLIAGDADVALCEFTLTKDRLKQVYFTHYVREDSYVLILGIPKSKRNRVFQPLAINVWLYRMLVTVLCVVVFYLVNRGMCTNHQRRSLSNWIIDIFSTQVCQSIPTNHFNSLSLSFMFGVWLSATVFFTAIYNSNLKAIFASRIQQSRMESLQDFIDFGEFPLIVRNNSYIHWLLQFGEGPLFSQTWQKVFSEQVKKIIYN